MRAVTILGPSQSGKTTLAEALAALEGRPTASQIGDVTLRTFRYLGEDWASLDIAGGADHLPAAAQALAASDAAVLCVPPTPTPPPRRALPAARGGQRRPRLPLHQPHGPGAIPHPRHRRGAPVLRRPFDRPPPGPDPRRRPGHRRRRPHLRTRLALRGRPPLLARPDARASATASRRRAPSFSNTSPISTTRSSNSSSRTGPRRPTASTR
jgi:hypothetical protein